MFVPLAKNGAGGEKEERRGREISRGQGTEGLISQTKESELYLAAQEQAGRNLNGGGARSDLCFMEHTMDAKGKMGLDRARLEAG